MNSDPAKNPVPARGDGPGLEDASKIRQNVKDESSALPTGSCERKQAAGGKVAQQVFSLALHCTAGSLLHCSVTCYPFFPWKVTSYKEDVLQVSTQDRVAPGKPTNSGRARIPIPKPVPAPIDDQAKGKVVSASLKVSENDGNKQGPLARLDRSSSARDGPGAKRERDSSTTWGNGQRYSNQRTSMNGGVSRGTSQRCIHLSSAIANDGIMSLQVSGC